MSIRQGPRPSRRAAPAALALLEALLAAVALVAAPAVVRASPDRSTRASSPAAAPAATAPPEAAPESPGPTVDAARQRNVLLLLQDSPVVQYVVGIADGVRATLRQRDEVTVYAENLDLSTFTGRGYADRLRAWLREKYRDVPLDLVLVVERGSLELATRPSPLWPGVPLVYCGFEAEPDATMPAPAGVTGVLQRAHIGETLALARRLLPDARQIALVGGAAPFDRRFEAPLRRGAAALPGRPEVVELFGLTADELGKRLAALPIGTPVVAISFARDGAGQPWGGPRLLAALGQHLTGPLFTVAEHMVGWGAIGGDAVDFTALGGEAGRLALRVLDGTPPGEFEVRRAAVSRIVLDGRLLDRWGIPDERLPPGAEVRFRTRPAWKDTLRTLAILGAALLVQGLLVGAVVFERSARRRAERAARQSLAEAAHLNRVAIASALASSLAHEISTPLASIQNGARAARRALAERGDADDRIVASLALIDAEGQRAGQVVKRLRSVLRREPAGGGAVDPAGLVLEAVALLSPLAREREVALRTELPAGLPSPSGDRGQLLQVLLNLMMNGIEAVSDLPLERRLVAVRAAAEPGGVRLDVSDAGDGFTPEARARIFEPFFTTRRDGLGAGLSLSRSIVEAHGGRLWLDPAPGGAVLHLFLPSGAASAAPAPTPEPAA